ncbi:MAG: alanine racemase [Hahellaceae bacterium]|nr:alanine racemase [Hahellaceae bacterium]MCP5212459.1 alanine racemase [Hahellaceae bacterium]
MRPTWAVIDIDAFVHNIAVAKKLAGGAEIIAVLKADAYGHGLEKMCRAAEGSGLVAKIALTSVEEAMRVRSQGVKCPIVLLEGCFEKNEIYWCLHNNVELVFHSAYQFDYLAQAYEVAASERKSTTEVLPKCRLWVKVNTGMNRLGFSLEEAKDWLDKVPQLPYVELVGTLMHFACADEVESESAQNQLELYQQFLLQAPGSGCKSALNSAALSRTPELAFDAVRPGVMLYGSSPLLDKTAKELGLKPVMHLLSRVIAIREINDGDEVGYGATWMAKRSCRMAVVAIGYADGYPRHASNLASVAVNGVVVPVIGRVSMDMITIDVSSVKDIAIGDEVELWGANIAVADVATLSGTISYELLTGITSRVPRFYRQGGKELV